MAVRTCCHAARRREAFHTRPRVCEKTECLEEIHRPELRSIGGSKSPEAVSGSLPPPRLTTDTSFLSASLRWNRLWPPADLHSKNSQQGNEPPAEGMQRDYGVSETASKIDCVQHLSSVHKMDTQVTLCLSL